MSTDARRLEYVAVDDLRPHPGNPKDHDLDLLRKSLGRWGYTIPVLVDERTGYLAAGHGRVALLIADRDTGAGPPEGVVLDKAGRWQVPVVRGWSSKDDVELQAYLVGDNQAARSGGWLDDKLAEILEVSFQSPAGLDGLGFEPTDLTELLARVGVTGDREASFVGDLIDPQFGSTQIGKRPVEQLDTAPTLTLTFTDREEREEVTHYLRDLAAQREVPSMGAALLGLVRDRRDA